MIAPQQGHVAPDLDMVPAPMKTVADYCAIRVGAKTVRMEGPHKTPLAHLWQVQYSGVVNAAFDVLGS